MVAGKKCAKSAFEHVVLVDTPVITGVVWQGPLTEFVAPTTDMGKAKKNIHQQKPSTLLIVSPLFYFVFVLSCSCFVLLCCVLGARMEERP